MKYVSNIARKFFAIIFCATTFATFAQGQEPEVQAYSFYETGIKAVEAKDYPTAITNLEKSVLIYDGITNSEIDITAVKAGAKDALLQTYYAYGMSLYQAKDFEKALVQFDKTETAAKAANADEMVEKALKYKGNVCYSQSADYFTKEDYDNAIASANEALKINGDDERAYLMRGRAYEKKGDLNSMKADLDKCMELTKGDDQKAKTYSNAAKIAGAAYMNAGTAAIKSKNYKEAVEMLNLAISYPEVNSNAYYYLAVSNNNLSKWNDAIEAANTALGLELKDPSAAYYELGKAYEGAGKTTDACNAYKKVTTGQAKEAAAYQIQHVLKCN